MSGRKYKNHKTLVNKLRDDFGSANKDFIFLFAYNGTGKTRLSMEFKERGKRISGQSRDTLYFNAFTEDLFSWDNDLRGDRQRVLKMNTDSRFFPDLEGLSIADKVRDFLNIYSDFTFSIDNETMEITFSREVLKGDRLEPIHNIKISRGEENTFIWCFFLAIAQLAIDGQDEYRWVKYIYIDDPISSLDDNNAITVACDLAKLLRQCTDEDRYDNAHKIKVIVSTHHSLFYNVIFNELNKFKHKKYFLHYLNDTEGYLLRNTDETPFFHHIAMITTLKKAIETGRLYTYHFNILRGILEKTATFFGLSEFSECIQDMENQVLYERALDILSHESYTIYEPREMREDNKRLFENILEAFLDKYKFELPELD